MADSGRYASHLKATSSKWARSTRRRSCRRPDPHEHASLSPAGRPLMYCGHTRVSPIDASLCTSPSPNDQSAKSQSLSTCACCN
jgi:hypothetical protein